MKRISNEAQPYCRKLLGAIAVNSTYQVEVTETGIKRLRKTSYHFEPKFGM